MMKIEPTIASLINSYRNLAQLWRSRAEALLDSRDLYGIADCVKRAQECDNKARQLEIRYIQMESR